MNSRERWLACMRFQAVDHVPDEEFGYGMRHFQPGTPRDCRNILTAIGKRTSSLALKPTRCCLYTEISCPVSSTRSWRKTKTISLYWIATAQRS